MIPLTSITTDIKNMVITAVCDYYEVSFDSIVKSNKNKTRKAEIIYPRQVIEYCLKVVAHESPSAISRITGVYHATVLHSATTIQNDVDCGNQRGLKALPVIQELNKMIRAHRARKLEKKEDFKSDIESELEEILNMK